MASEDCEALKQRVEQAERDRDEWADRHSLEVRRAEHVIADLAQAEREREEMRQALDPGTAPRIVAGMFAEAQKRGMSPFSSEHALGWLCSQLDAARAEVERLKGEGGESSRVLISTRLLAAEKLKEFRERAEQAEVDLARVRAALQRACLLFDQGYTDTALVPEPDEIEWREQARAALEGRG